MADPVEAPTAVRIETFPSPFQLDLQPRWMGLRPDGSWGAALHHPWGERHRPDWHRRGLIISPRGGGDLELRLALACPQPWLDLASRAQARLVLRWWAEDAQLAVDGSLVHRGDLFDCACRWVLPERWWSGAQLQLQLRLRSPLHDDGALVHSRIELDPLDPTDPDGLLQPIRQQLAALPRPSGSDAPGWFQVLGHAHLDLAWLWPVADTWQAAVRTFESVLGLLEQDPRLHFAHSTPALYAWLQEHRPALFARIGAAVAAGRFEPVNGPWVETDCVLISSASLLRQFQLGQRWSRQTFPQLEHRLAWLPDSFGFGAGLPAIAQATGVRWFCTHKLAWNATNAFPHRLFRWRSRCGSELLALLTAPIGSDADPVAMETYRLQWQQVTGLEQALWLPGVGDHGGGPTAEMLAQLALWQRQAELGAPLGQQRHGTLRQYLQGLEPLALTLPIWRDELYLELHRGCATSRPDQKRHNRSLERLLREADLALALVQLSRRETTPTDWRPLLFQQFHDILPGTSVPEVYEQAEPQWRAARRQARRCRDEALLTWLAGTLLAGPLLAAGSGAAASGTWVVAQLQPLPAWRPCLRLPAGSWCDGDGAPLPVQRAAAGGSWVQLPPLAGVGAALLKRCPGEAAGPVADQPVSVTPLPGGGWQLDNGLLRAVIGAGGLEQLSDADGRPYLAAAARLRRYRDAGEFWDAWDLAADYRAHEQPIRWSPDLQWRERGPLCCRMSWRGWFGTSSLRLDGQLLAGSPWFELVISIDWRQRHELLRFELPVAQLVRRWAADTSGGVLERPGEPLNARERSRWEVPVISWLAAEAAAPGGGLGILLDGPQGVSASPGALGVSLLRGPTWPDPGADNGWQRQRLALMPCPQGWCRAALPQAAVRFREPIWRRPLAVTEALTGALTGALPLGLPELGSHLQLLGLRPCSQHPGTAVISVQNLSPLRQRLDPGPGWQLLQRLDGLDQDLIAAGVESMDSSIEARTLAPWATGFWRLAAAQSS